MLNRILIITSFLLCSPSGFSQLAVTPTSNIAPLITGTLVSNGVQVSNIRFNGQATGYTTNQVGSFTNSGTNLSFASGIVMSTGNSNGVEGPNDDPEFTSNANSNPSPNTDADLRSVAQANGNNNINDVCIIEFDFVATGDSISFEYIFASDEYDFYANSEYNDVFGFFLSGPGINGPYSGNARNIALIPNTNLPVTINNVNNGSGNNGPCNYCQYYNQDSPDDMANTWNNQNNPFFSNAAYMQMDGYTDPFKAGSRVQCGSTYHIKLGIADVGDDQFDSAVFLKGGSFSSTGQPMTAIIQNTSVPVVGSLIHESCSNNNLLLNRNPNFTGDTLFYNIAVSGTATLVADYSIPTLQGMFLPGQSSITIPITTIADGVAEGTETIVLSIHSVNSCSGFTQDQVISLTIDDNVPPLVITGNNPTICYNTSATITPIVTGGFGQYTYLWNTGATSQTLSSTYTTTTTVTLTVSDVCNTAPVTQSFTITVQPPIADLISTSQPAQFTLNCLGSQNVMATANAGAAITSVQWFWNGQPQTSTGYSMMISSSMGPGIATIVAVNSCNQADSISFESIIYNEPLVLNLPDTIFGSCSALSAVSPTYTGGEGTVNFAWFNLSTGSSLGSTQSVLFSDNTEQSLLLVGVDQCGSVDSSTTLFYLPPNPLIAYMPSDTTICYGQSLVLSPDLSGGDLPYIYRWSTTALNPTITAHPLGDTLYYVVVTDACNRTDSLSIDVTVDVIDGIINVIEASNSSYLFTPVVQSTSDYTTFWDFGDGTSSNDRAPLHEYSTESEYLITLDMATLNGCTASAQITVKPGAFLYIPNAFTPDGDGVNDAFQISVTAAKSGSITIYNRWGQIVFETTDLNATWVGNYQPGEYYFVPDDVYNYEVVVESITGDVIKKRGTITILR